MRTIQQDKCFSIVDNPRVTWGRMSWRKRDGAVETDANLALPVQFSKEKYILDSSPEKLHKELEEELKLSSTDLRSHAWYHGRIPREVSKPQAYSLARLRF